MSVTQKVNTIEQYEEIRKTLGNQNCLFRGEPQEFDKISSGLYRYTHLPTNSYISAFGANATIRVIMTRASDNLKDLDSEIQQAQKGIRENIVNYIQTNKLSEMTSFSSEYIQHYGGITNYIDFTTNFEIATYFACSKEHNEDGRIIVINSKDHEVINLYNDPRFIQNKRIQKQESILVEQEYGHIELDDCETILIISKHIKKAILASLDEKNINEKTIYPDEGDIETNQYIQQLKLELFNLPKHLTRAKKLHTMGLNKININKGRAIRLLKKSIEEYDNAIEINPDYHTPYTLKAEILLVLNELTKEISYAKASLENCELSIQLNPKGEEPLLHNPRFRKQFISSNKKGIAYRIKGVILKQIYNNHYLALKNLSKAIEINPSDSQAYYHRGLIYCWQYETTTTKELKMQKLDMAIKDFQKQIDVIPKQEVNITYTRCRELKDKAITERNKLDNH